MKKSKLEQNVKMVDVSEKITFVGKEDGVAKYEIENLGNGANRIVPETLIHKSEKINYSNYESKKKS